LCQSIDMKNILYSITYIELLNLNKATVTQCQSWCGGFPNMLSRTYLGNSILFVFISLTY